MFSNTNNKGFTLLEMIVSLGIFSVVAVVAVASLVRITGLNMQARDLQTTMTHLGFSLESMSREIRMGTEHGCFGDFASINWSSYSVNSGNACEGGNNILVFKSALTDSNGNHLLIAYWMKSFGNIPFLTRAKQKTFNGSVSQTDFSSVLYDTNIKLSGSVPPFRLVKNGNYNWVSLRLKGETGTRPQDMKPFDIQTSVASRMPD